jgi:ribosomal protein S18 acetylase RimI-like enzyme
MPMRVMPLLSGLDVSRPSARDDYTPAVHAATITLREATTTDVPTLLALVHAAFEQYRDCLDPPSGAHRETEASLRAALHAGGALLACVDGRPIGCVFYQRERDHVYVGRLSVLPPFRRRGVGQALTNDVERRAQAMGMPRVQLGVRTALPRLRAYYERCGYRVVREERHAGYEAPTYVVMEKDLR